MCWARCVGPSWRSSVLTNPGLCFIPDSFVCVCLRTSLCARRTLRFDICEFGPSLYICPLQCACSTGTSFWLYLCLESGSWKWVGSSPAFFVHSSYISVPAPAACMQTGWFPQQRCLGVWCTKMLVTARIAVFC